MHSTPPTVIASVAMFIERGDNGTFGVTWDDDPEVRMSYAAAYELSGTLTKIGVECRWLDAHKRRDE